MMINDKDNNRIYKVYNKVKQAMKADKQELVKGMNSSMLNVQIVPRSDLTEIENIKYFEQFKKLYYASFCMNSQMREFSKVNLDLKNKIDEVDRNIQNYQKSQRTIKIVKTSKQKPKRFRRTNEMIQRNFRCTYTKCDKAYASEGSLQQHIRLKHEDSLLDCNHSKQQRKQQKQQHQEEVSDQCSDSEDLEQSQEQMEIKKQQYC